MSTTSKSELVSVEVHDMVATITLNRPDKLNAMTPVMADALQAIVDDINARDEVRAVVLTGAGPKAFCAGSDIKDLDHYQTAWQFRNRPDYCDAIRALLKPTIAAVNGYALGGGLEMALSCDIRLASETASFAAPEVKLGWIGGGGMTAQLALSIGASNAAMMVMTGDRISAKQAEQWGLVSALHAPDALLGEALALARTIASRAPIAAETARANLKAAYNMPLEDAIRYERDLQTICFATYDAMEGRAAFAEKREPEFKRR
ncbi:MAG: enoyl-CoA hydratase/isomerase family protein [Devosiaceae bacterium]